MTLQVHVNWSLNVLYVTQCREMTVANTCTISCNTMYSTVHYAWCLDAWMKFMKLQIKVNVKLLLLLL